ncbi:MlaD family protein [Mycobacterium sp.]|uniref:MlaD family protein n=1 Tax=Mycobacterium sp. TaxID=1785 RepID=UPI002C746003|nr:MlaD family protein [Mycobacterium sp.]HKP42699.1 MlaD family protein [Mycobacterium sp.]
MHLNRSTKLQLALFAIITLVAGALMSFRVLDLPNLWFGVGRYRVSVELPTAAGLYTNSNVTYRGTTVGRVEAVKLGPTGATAVLTLDSAVKIPANLRAQVHSQTAVGEVFVELEPRSGDGPTLADGDVITLDRTTVPPDINALLSATNTGLQAIPRDNLKAAVDDAYTAVGGLGPELSRIVRGSTTLTIDAKKNLDSITTLIDQSKPLLDSQTDTSDAIQAWAANVANVTGQLRDQDASVRGLLQNGPAAFGETKALLDRLNVSVPILLSNLVGLTQTALVYQPNIEQVLVLVPGAIELVQGATLASRNTKQDYKGVYLSFNLNLNLPPPCTTGFLPAQQQRAPSATDYPDRPEGSLYCRIPQDAMFNVRGARNLPCETRPGKRAPTVKMCESDEDYVPLNDGYNWKGDPNATPSGQPIPQMPPDAALPSAAPAAPAPPIGTATYDPATGSYIGPDGRTYTQSNLAQGSGAPRTWQDMLTAPKGN